jgi:hypothetical protein
MRGRYPAGLECLDQRDASDQAKERVRVTVQILTGACRVGEACAALGIGSARLEQVRRAVVDAALAAAERQPAGRKRRVPSAEEAELELLRQRVAQLEAELQAALVRAELAATLPRVGAADDAEKKTTPPSRRRRPGTPKS